MKHAAAIVRTIPRVESVVLASEQDVRTDVGIITVWGESNGLPRLEKMKWSQCAKERAVKRSLAHNLLPAPIGCRQKYAFRACSGLC